MGKKNKHKKHGFGASGNITNFLHSKVHAVIFLGMAMCWTTPVWAEGSAESNANALNVAQQSNVLTGGVSDQDGPLIGVTVVEKGSTRGAITDADGRYTITGLRKGAKIVVSFVGYKTQEFTYNGQHTLNIKLTSDAQNLDEVMVVAYGTTRRSSFTGSASSVKGTDLQKISGNSFVGALQGMSSGVAVFDNEGVPGADARIQIRGIGSMSGETTPLYIVDGMPYDGALNSINNNDIESMTVLKDAAASALYGSRAANGVVVITTKKGGQGKTKVNFRASWGTSDMAVPLGRKANPYEQLLINWQSLYNDQRYDLGMDAQAAGDYASANVLFTNNARVNSAGETVYVTPFKWPGSESKYVLHDGNGNAYTNPDLQMVWGKDDWDWYKAIFSHKLRQDYGVDFSGTSNNGKTNYYASIGYLNDKGYSNNDYYKRYAFRVNATSQIKNWLTIGGSLNYTYARQHNFGWNRALMFTNTLTGPWMRNADNTEWIRSEKTGWKVYDYDVNNAQYFGLPVYNKGDYWNNPNDEDFNFNGTPNSNEFNTVVASYFTEINLPFGIKFRTSMNLGDNAQHGYGYSSAVWGDYGQIAPYGLSVKAEGGSATRVNYDTRTLTWNNVLSWDKSFGEHNISLMAGHEWYNYNQQYDYSYGEGIMTTGQFETSSTTKNWSISSNRTRYSLLSYFGRAEYNYASRYYLSTSIRRDGSSIFSSKNRWGTFWSLGGSWRISQEKFMEPTKSWLDNLSVRASYGTTGNDRLNARNQNRGTAGGRIYYGYQDYYTTSNWHETAGYMPSNIRTEDLKWESNKQFNVGLDFGIFGLISGSVEYYHRTSSDLLYYHDLPYSAQVGSASGYNTNLGDILNEGFEFNINATPIKSRLVWTINLNLTTLHNEVTSLPSGDIYWGNRVGKYRLSEGKSLYEFYMVKSAGVNPETGLEEFWEKDDNDNWIKTSDFDESIKNRQWIGSAIPKVYGSITNNLSWNNFDFSMMWYASFGSKMMDYMVFENSTGRPGCGLNMDYAYKDTWKKPGDNAKFPRWSYSNSSRTRRASDRFVYNNEYLRLRNVTFGYTLPKTLLNKVGIEHLRVYITGDNLLTFGPAAHRHTDPEVGLTGNNYNGNADTDNGVMEARRVYMAGIQITF